MTISRTYQAIKREIRIGYTSHTTSLIHGGGKLSFEVKRGLLQPAADVAGLLRFNGSTLYIPRGRQITIGSSKESDIRIIDSKIDDLHAIITPFDGGFIINDLSLGNDLAVRDKATGQITRLLSAPHEMTSDGSLFFRLSGIANSNKARLLEVKIEISPANVTEAIQALFAAPSPAVEVVSPETALVRVKSNEEVSAVTPRIENRFNDFLASENKTIKQARVMALGALLSSLSLMSVIFSGLMINASIATGAIIFWACFAAMTVLSSVMAYCVTRLERLMNARDASLKAAINGATPNEIARLLSKVKKEDKNRILFSIKDFDRDLAMKIIKELKLLAKKSDNSPEQLPAELPAVDKARTRVAESLSSGDSRKRVSEPPAPVQEVVEVEAGVEETAEGKRSV
ncbi:MAG: FHA domain-containing protein [Candidatus Margulisiibacteriota bacterium]|jgi:hypothetical protein